MLSIQIAVNPCGIMGSQGELENLSLHDYARGIAKTIEWLQFDRLHLVGGARGNRLALIVASDFPDKVSRVSLIAAGSKLWLAPVVTWHEYQWHKGGFLLSIFYGKPATGDIRKCLTLQ